MRYADLMKRAKRGSGTPVRGGGRESGDCKRYLELGKLSLKAGVQHDDDDDHCDDEGSRSEVLFGGAKGTHEQERESEGQESGIW